MLRHVRHPLLVAVVATLGLAVCGCSTASSDPASSTSEPVPSTTVPSGWERRDDPFAPVSYALPSRFVEIDTDAIASGELAAPQEWRTAARYFDTSVTEMAEYNATITALARGTRADGGFMTFDYLTSIPVTGYPRATAEELDGVEEDLRVDGLDTYRDVSDAVEMPSGVGRVAVLYRSLVDSGALGGPRTWEALILLRHPQGGRVMSLQMRYEDELCELTDDFVASLRPA